MRHGNVRLGKLARERSERGPGDTPTSECGNVEGRRALRIAERDRANLDSRVTERITEIDREELRAAARRVGDHLEHAERHLGHHRPSRENLAPPPTIVTWRWKTANAGSVLELGRGAVAERRHPSARSSLR